MSFWQLFSRYMYVKNDIRTKNSYVYVDEIDTWKTFEWPMKVTKMKA